MDWLSQFLGWTSQLRAVASEIGPLLFFGILLLVIGGVVLPIFVTIPDGLKRRFPTIESLFFIVQSGLILAGILFSLLSLPIKLLLILFPVILISAVLAWIFHRRRTRRKDQAPTEIKPETKRLQLIAWDGFNEDEVKSSFSSKPRPDILEYVRGVEKVTHLKYEGSLFDVLIADVEFLTRHNLGQKLLSLQGPHYEPLWDKIPLALRMQIKNAGNQLGIPVRCGLNAIIINTRAAEKVLGNPHISSYSDLQLSKILPVSTTQCRIGIWNWYLPSLSILLLTEDRISLQNVWAQPLGKIKTIIDIMVDINNRDKFLLLDDPKDATDHLVNGDVWVIPGGAGWLMPLESERRKDLKVIVPQEGAIMWVECAAIIRNPEGGEDLSRGLIQHYLESKTQLLLAQRRAYRTCPVTTEALRALSAPIASVVDCNNIFDGDRLRAEVVLRKLPQDAPAWEECWEKVELHVPRT